MNDESPQAWIPSLSSKVKSRHGTLSRSLHRPVGLDPMLVRALIGPHTTQYPERRNFRRQSTAPVLHSSFYHWPFCSILVWVLLLSHQLLLVVNSLTYTRIGYISTSYTDGHFLVDVMVQAVSTTPYGRFDHVISLIPDIERVKERIPCVPPLLKDISMHVSRCPYSVATYFRYTDFYFAPR